MSRNYDGRIQTAVSESSKLGESDSSFRTLDSFTFGRGRREKLGFHIGGREDLNSTCFTQVVWKNKWGLHQVTDHWL
uniref:Uncharacterized protein n=1 Tax=Nelumbo nucifera TaxID=4432 RepID=A0A822Y790_NELNU|nr:TPA_asm: hypothetical protein HUJ06_029838 [Nelumbo nucifera]